MPSEYLEYISVTAYVMLFSVEPNSMNYFILLDELVANVWVSVMLGQSTMIIAYTDLFSLFCLEFL